MQTRSISVSGASAGITPTSTPSTRITALQHGLSKSKLDALLVSNAYNLYYLTGFRGLSPAAREAWGLVTRKNVYVLTDGRYYGQIKKSPLRPAKGRASPGQANLTSQIAALLISPDSNLNYHLREVVKREKIKKLGFEAEDLKYSEFVRFKKTATLSPTNNLVLNLRAQKDADEVKKVIASCRLTARCLADIVKTIRTGQMEREIAFRLEFWLKEHGADTAFYPIVAVGKNSALPHYDARARGRDKVKKGQPILIDLGALYRGYCSDMTRVFFVGKPSDEVANVYETVLHAQNSAIEQLEKSTSAMDIDTQCRRLITDHRLPSFPHSTGHGVGLEIHELPKIATKSKDTITKDHIFTIEPGVYLAGRFGIRIEDTVWMKEVKKPEILTTFPKRPLII